MYDRARRRETIRSAANRARNLADDRLGCTTISDLKEAVSALADAIEALADLSEEADG